MPYDLYIPKTGPHISCSRIGRSILGIYINHSQTHECGNWDCGRAIPFLGIYVSNFRYWFFEVNLYLYLSFHEVNLYLYLSFHYVTMLLHVHVRHAVKWLVQI